MTTELDAYYSTEDLLAMAFNMLRECDKLDLRRLRWLRCNATMDTFRRRIQENAHFAPDAEIYEDSLTPSRDIA